MSYTVQIVKPLEEIFFFYILGYIHNIDLTCILIQNLLKMIGSVVTVGLINIGNIK